MNKPHTISLRDLKFALKMLKPFQLFPPLYRIVFFDFHENPRTRFFKNTIQAGGMPQTLKVGLTTQVFFFKKKYYSI